MRIVVNHLTRMRGERICVAGVDRTSALHVRPIVAAGRLTRRDLVANGGIFEIGGEVDLSDVEPRPSPPEVEDHSFTLLNATYCGRLAPAEYLGVVDAMAEDSLEEALGSALVRLKWKYGVEPGKGDRSLGVVRLARRPNLEVGQFDDLKLRYNDGSKPAYLPVTDLRLFGPDGTILTAATKDAASRMRRGVRTWLMVGLTRPWSPSENDPAWHWLQVNGICLEDRPLGETP